MTKTCAIIGGSPLCFPWGFDEEDEGCAALKLLLFHWITRLRGEGCARFAVSMDCGAGLYAAELLQGLRETDRALAAVFCVPHEEQATKWTPALRDRYFAALAASTEVISIARRKTVDCAFRAHLEAMREADTVLAVYDPEDPRCAREAAAVAVAEMLGKRVLVLAPGAIRPA